MEVMRKLGLILIIFFLGILNVSAITNDECIGNNCLVKDVTSYTSSLSRDLNYGTFPAYYNSREQNYVSNIEDQQNTGTCGFFSSLTVLETYFKKHYQTNFEFSSRHMAYSTARTFLNNEINTIGYNKGPEVSNMWMIANLFASNFAPVLESALPFENNTSLMLLSSIQNQKNAVDVNDIKIQSRAFGLKCEVNEILEIKAEIVENGAANAQLHMTTNSPYYNASTASYYYNGSEDTNHAVVIIGWDDNYARTNFNNMPTSNGAWIIQNSYGTSFGKNGLMYVSYEDVHICETILTIKDADFEVADNSYVYDNLYINWYKNNIKSKAYAMNVFNKKTSNIEELDKITFYTEGPGKYKIYYKDGNASNSSVSSMTQIGSGTMNYQGYISHELDKSLLVNSSSFSIAVYYELSYDGYPIQYSGYDKNDNYRTHLTTLNSNQSYISTNGTNWTDLSIDNNFYSVLPIKAFTNNVSINVNDYEIEQLNDKIKINLLGNINLMHQSLSLDFTINSTKITDAKLNLIPKFYTSNVYSLKHFTGSYLEFSALTSGTYSLKLSHSEADLSKQFNVEIIDQITSEKYTIDQNKKIIKASVIAEKASEFKNYLNAKKYVIFNNSNRVNESDVIGTGMTIGNYHISILGDVTGDGVVKMNDVMKISNHIVNGSILDDDSILVASDVNNDGNIRMNDVMKISKYIVDGEAI